MKTMTRRSFAALSAGAIMALAGCGGTQSGSDGATQDQLSSSDPAKEPLYTFRFADVEEGARLKMENVDYIDGLNQCDLDFRVQKKGATLEEYETLSVSQCADFTDKEMAALTAAMAEMERRIAERGITLPASEEIIFIKDEMEDELGAAAYTHGTQIYLSTLFINMLSSDDEQTRTECIRLLAHELFHCLTRSNPDFRASMYKIIGFDVQEEDYDFGPAVREKMISNPDVEHHNSSALFTIDGEQRRCTVVFYAKQPFEKKGDTFFDLGGTGLVPVDDLNTLYDSEQASDFWEVFGENTDCVIDPEETMADNFSFLVADGRDGMEYKTPRIIDEILATLGA